MQRASCRGPTLLFRVPSTVIPLVPALPRTGQGWQPRRINSPRRVWKKCLHTRAGQEFTLSLDDVPRFVVRTGMIWKVGSRADY